MITQDRTAIRKFYFDTYRAWRAGETLAPLQHQLADLFKLHPEYDLFFADYKKNKDRDLLNKVNPIMHLGLHQSIREQVATDRPKGIAKIYQQLLKQWQLDVHEVEHRMMACLTELFRVADFSESDYLAALRELLK